MGEYYKYNYNVTVKKPQRKRFIAQLMKNPYTGVVWYFTSPDVAVCWENPNNAAFTTDQESIEVGKVYTGLISSDYVPVKEFTVTVKEA